MAEKVTTIKLKVDLQCCKSYKKVKKVLCKFPQIRDQVYDDKQNIVTITVVCCDPEKLRDKLCCKGCGAIKSVEIVEPPKPTPPPEKNPEPKPCPCPPHVVLVCPPPPVSYCYVPCHCHEGGHCCHGPPPCYYCRPSYVSRCEVYHCEENTSACTIV